MNRNAAESKKKFFFCRKRTKKTFDPLRTVLKRPQAESYQGFFASSFCSQKEVFAFLGPLP